MVLLVFLLTGTSSQALVLDWDNVTWTTGSLSQSYDVDAENPGNDITITIQDPGSVIANAYPGLDSTPHGGYSGANGTLEVQMQLTSVYSQIIVTVTFHYADGVKGVNASIFDIDKPGGGQPDQLRNFYATTVSGLLVGPSVVTSVANTSSGSGTNLTVTGTASAGNAGGDGNVDYNFGTNLITQYTYTFGVDTNSGGGSGGGQIQFWHHDIRYQPKVPETGPALMATVCCLGMVAMGYWRRRQEKVSAPT
jgi:hypothetical protein